jgi:Late competence development protein ComFB
MSAFEQIHNHHEQLVIAAVHEFAPAYPAIHDEDALADVACVALNRLPPRYIRHSIDFAFYTPDRERIETDSAVHDAVHQAFAFVQARRAMRARR